MSTTIKAICTKCRHYRMRPKLRLFSPADLQISGILKTRLEWEQRERQRADIEEQRYSVGEEFDYEPYSYAWCWAYTYLDPPDGPRIEEALAAGQRDKARQILEESAAHSAQRLRRAEAGDEAALEELAECGGATMNPVTGQISQLYALCQRMNPDGRCALFDPR